MMLFRDIRKFLAPPWLVEGDGELVGYSLDLMKDAFIERLRLGRLAHFPQQNPAGDPAPHDALEQMGRDRRIFYGIFDTDRTYAAKLLPWLDNRKTTGNPFTIMKRLAEYCGPLPSFRTVDDHGNWFSRAADGTETYLLDQGNWNWDNLGGTLVDASTGEEVWSRFWVIIYPNGLWNEGDGAWNDADEEAWGETYDAGGAPPSYTPDSPLGWGTTATTDQVQTLRSIVKDQMPAGTVCVNIILAFDGASFDPATPEPDGNWGQSGKIVNGVRVASRLATARYLDGA